MDRVLEKSRYARMDVLLADSNLATRILGSPTSTCRVVRRKMAIREKQSGAPLFGFSRRKLAVPGRAQCSRVAWSVMEGGSLRRRNASLVRDGLAELAPPGPTSTANCRLRGTRSSYQ